jgi:hypothetical protein
MHCKENPIYALQVKKLRGLSPNFRIHISLSDLYIPRIGPPIFLQQNRQELGLRPRSFIYGNICFEFSVYCLCSVTASLKGLSHEIDFKNVDENGQILALIRAAAGF